MGNSLGCSALGERLVSAARDGDLQEAQALLECNPSLSKYSAFGSLNSPLHYAAAKGHNEIVCLLLEHGADVNGRNYCGQTALMQACRYGHWEVVLTLLLYNANVFMADYFNHSTAFHFAAFNGHAHCLRLLVADYAPHDCEEQPSSGKSKRSPSNGQPDNALSKLVSGAADGGITALHMAALNRHLDCVLLLLDLSADVALTTFHYGSTFDSIGAGSTPLHYAACGGSIQCCQALISRGASRTTLNCNGWVAWDVAKYWGRQWLEPLLALDSQMSIPHLPPSGFLCLPLKSALDIARECGLRDTDSSTEGIMDLCAVCLERKCMVAAAGCGHELCTRCALYLCSTSDSSRQAADPPGSIPCPLCRHGIMLFVKLSATKNVEDTWRPFSLGLCTACSVDECDGAAYSGPIPRPSSGRNRISPISSESIRKLTCTGFPAVNLQLCSCSELVRGVCPSIQPYGASVPVERSASN